MEQLQEVIDHIKSEQELSGVALLSSDGISLFENLPAYVEADNFAQLASGMMAFARLLLLRSQGRDSLKNVLIHSDQGRLCLSPLQDGNMVLSVLTPTDQAEEESRAIVGTLMNTLDMAAH